MFNTVPTSHIYICFQKGVIQYIGAIRLNDETVSLRAMILDVLVSEHAVMSVVCTCISILLLVIINLTLLHVFVLLLVILLCVELWMALDIQSRCIWEHYDLTDVANLDISWQPIQDATGQFCMCSLCKLTLYNSENRICMTKSRSR